MRFIAGMKRRFFCKKVRHPFKMIVKGGWMNMEREEQALQTDQNDLLAILVMRFGTIPEEVREKIEQIDQLDVVERLILVAANVPTWELFLKELDEGQDSFRLVGQMYDPLANSEHNE